MPADVSCAGAIVAADDGKRGFAGRHAYLRGRAVARQQDQLAILSAEHQQLAIPPSTLSGSGWASWFWKAAGCRSLCDLDRSILSQIARAPMQDDAERPEPSRDMKLVDRFLSSGRKPLLSFHAIYDDLGFHHSSAKERLLEIAECVTRCSKYSWQALLQTLFALKKDGHVTLQAIRAGLMADEASRRLRYTGSDVQSPSASAPGAVTLPLNDAADEPELMKMRL